MLRTVKVAILGVGMMVTYTINGMTTSVIDTDMLDTDVIGITDISVSFSDSPKDISSVTPVTSPKTLSSTMPTGICRTRKVAPKSSQPIPTWAYASRHLTEAITEAKKSVRNTQHKRNNVSHDQDWLDKSFQESCAIGDASGLIKAMGKLDVKSDTPDLKTTHVINITKNIRAAFFKTTTTLASLMALCSTRILKTGIITQKDIVLKIQGLICSKSSDDADVIQYLLTKNRTEHDKKTMDLISDKEILSWIDRKPIDDIMSVLQQELGQRKAQSKTSVLTPMMVA